MQVTEFPAAELDKLRAKMKPVIEKRSEKVGADTRERGVRHPGQAARCQISAGLHTHLRQAPSGAGVGIAARPVAAIGADNAVFPLVTLIPPP